MVVSVSYGDFDDPLSEEDEMPAAGESVRCPFTRDSICYGGCRTPRTRACINGEDNDETE